MDVRTDRESDAVAAVTVISALLLWLIKSYFDIWNSASRASLTKLKESISCSWGHDNNCVVWSSVASTSKYDDSRSKVNINSSESFQIL